MRSIERRGFESFLALAAFGALTALAPAAMLQPTVVGVVPQAVSGMHDLGRAGAGVRVDLALRLSYRNDGELERLIAQLSDDASPLHDRFLTSEQFRAYFSPTPQTYAHTLLLLQRAGFTVTHTNRSRTHIDVSAPAPVVERYFRTEIRLVSVEGSRAPRYVNTRPAFLPEELRGVVAFVFGFNNIDAFKPLYRVAQRGSVRPHGIPDMQIGQPLHGPGGGFGPLAFAQGYDMPVQHQIPGKPKGTTYDGTGRIAAIEIPADPADSDLSKFLSFFKVTRTGSTTRVPVDGGPVSPSGGASLEAALDYETIAGVAPGANIYIYEFPGFTATQVIDGYDAAVDDNKADTINSSFGACETSGFFDPRGIAHAFRQGLVQGQTFHSSSGDSGTFTFGCSSTVSVLTPTDTPYTTSIGGTLLSVDSNGNYVSESYWNDSSGAGGGGVSKVFTLHAWQKNVPTITQGGRNVPDISFDASAASGEDIWFGGSFFGTVGGTSLASPIFGGCLVEVEQVLGHRVHKVNPRLYHHWLSDGYSSGSTVFAHDITTGTPFGILKPGKGYDLATGIGSLDCFVGGQKYL